MRVCQFRHSGTIGSSAIGWIGSNIQCTKGSGDDQTGSELKTIRFEGGDTGSRVYAATNLEKRTSAASKAASRLGRFTARLDG
jgi:hypothetical protein